MPAKKSDEDDVFPQAAFGCTMEEIAKEFGVTRSAASQMCAAAYKAFRKELFKRLIEKDDIIPD